MNLSQLKSLRNFLWLFATLEVIANVFTLYQFVANKTSITNLSFPYEILRLFLGIITLITAHCIYRLQRHIRSRQG